MTPYQISLEIFGGFYYSGITLNESDPAVVAPTIAEKPPPSSKELFQSRKTRFKSNKTVETSDNLTTKGV